MKFSALVKAFMDLELFSARDQITILGALAAEPLTKQSALSSAVLLAHKFREKGQHELLDALTDATGVWFRRSIYCQETVHVFQHPYKELAKKLLRHYKHWRNKPHGLPGDLVATFQDEIYQSISVRSLLNVAYHLLLEQNHLELLVAELEDARATCLTGFVTRVVNATVPFISFPFVSQEYEIEKIVNKFTRHLQENGVYDHADIMTHVARQADLMLPANLETILLALRRYTGMEWYCDNNKFVCAF